MKKERTAEFKKRIALEALKEQKTVREIATEYEVNPMQVCKWKKALYENATQLFESPNRKRDVEKSMQEREAKLHEKIGQLTVELDWMKKKLELSSDEKRLFIEPAHKKIPIYRQCKLIGLNRSTYYLEPKCETPENLKIMRLIDEEYTIHPFLGSRKLRLLLKEKGYIVNRKRIQRLMQKMGIEAIYPKKNLSQAGRVEKKYPYLLAGLEIVRPDQVWSTDITYIRLAKGFLYLVAILDWFSRYVLAWELSNTLDVGFCLNVLEKALKIGKPEIFNNDQGSQFTSEAFTAALQSKEITISWDGKGRAFDNIFIERLWRSVKYEEVYPRGYETGKEAWRGLNEYFNYYNNKRPHQSLGYKKPNEIYFCSRA